MDGLKKIIIGVLAAGIFNLLIPVSWAAATPTLTPVGLDGIIRIDDVFPVTLKLDSAGMNVNSLAARIRYSTIGLEVVRVEKNTKNFPLWADDPTWNNEQGELYFTAGRPNGLIAAGATVATIYLRARVSGLWQLSIEAESKIMSNSEDGVPGALVGPRLDIPVIDPLVAVEQISSSSHPDPTTWYNRSTVEISWPVKAGRQYRYTLTTDPRRSLESEKVTELTSTAYTDIADGIWWFVWQPRGADGVWGSVVRRLILVDTTPPEISAITQLPPSSVGGALVINWLASDEASGIKNTNLYVRGRDRGEATSPMVVDQRWAGQLIKIRVADRAGNYREATWHDPRSTDRIGWLMAVSGGGLLLAVLFAGYFLWWRKKTTGKS